MSDVQEGAAHGDLDAVRTALEADSTLAKAAWDWDAGDWETALGATSHMGRRDIAELLLAPHPDARETNGPHGIPLHEHAVAGGEQAQAVLELVDAL